MYQRTIVSGSLMASRLSRTNMLEISFKGFCWVLGVMMTTFFTCYGGLWIMGYNPAWAQTKATTACINIHWEKVYRDVLVLSAVRASGLITGM